MQYTITSADWTQISAAGKVISVYVDEQSDGAVNNAQVRVYGSKTKPVDADFTKAKRVFRPTGNTDVLQLTPDNEDIIFWAKCLDGGESIITVETGLVGAVKNLDVAVQDQHSDIVDVYMCTFLNAVTLASAATVNTRTVTLEAGHGFVVGDVLCMKNGTWYQGRVINVATNVITVNQPFNETFPIGFVGNRTNSNMAVNGSVTPVTFTMRPPEGKKWDITRLLMVIRDDAAMDDGKFGAITGGLAVGTMFRVKKSATQYNNLFNARTNGEFAIRAYDVQYTDATLGPSGQYGLRVRRSFNGYDKNGVVIRLKGDGVEEFQIVVQDDLTSLAYFQAVIQGHVVEE